MLKASFKRMLAVLGIAFSITACCSGDGGDPLEAARNDASSDLGCATSELTAHVEWQDSSCDADGNCTDHIWVTAAGCGRTALYDCTQCWDAYDCSRSN